MLPSRMQTTQNNPPVNQKPDWLKITAIAYLLFPLIIFVLGNCRWTISLPFLLLESWMLFRILRASSQGSTSDKKRWKDWLPALTILAAWVLLSGIGGYMYQNSDHDTRNAILRDLIRHDWPVTYQQESGSGTKTFGLVYYTGFWLPAALVGKLLGWKAANLALFLWTLLGVGLTTALVRKRIKSSWVFAAILLVAFSGLDFLGKSLVSIAGIVDYPPLWPPISHLEWWSVMFQYSSFTSQLFWVFNQAIPCWVAMGLILTEINKRNLVFTWSLGFFLSPIAMAAFLPLLALRVFTTQQGETAGVISKTKALILRLKQSLIDVLSLENLLGGGAVLLLSLAYFSANPYGTRFGLIEFKIPVLILMLFFITFDYLLLWLLLRTQYKGNPGFLLTGILLFLIPFFSLGKGYDFSMRASLTYLFCLMVWSGEALHKPSTKAFKIALVALLAIGALTPLYEINRSVYRTVKYYTEVRSGSIVSALPKPPSEPVPFPPEVGAPELVHPDTLTADAYQTLTYFDLETLGNYVGETENSFFFRYITKP